MKKLILLPILLLSLSVFAQELKIGPVVGFNFAKYGYGPKMDEVKMPSILRTQLGIVGEYSLTEMFALKSGIILVGRGTKMKADVTENGIRSTLEFKVKTLNLHIPLLVGIKLPVNDLDFAIFTGPSLGFALSAKGDGSWSNIGTIGEGSGSNNTIPIGNNDSDFIKSTDMGWEFAVGAGLSKFNLPLNITLSYTLGLTNLDPNPEPNSYMRNRSLNFTVAYLFKVKD